MAIWEDDQLKHRLEELAQRAARRGRPMCTPFLTPPEAHLAQAIGRQCGVETVCSAGYPEGERQICCFYPAEEAPVFDLRCLEIHWQTRSAGPSHRDLLGAVMALGMDRSQMGDLLVWPDRALLFCLPALARLVEEQLSQAGNVMIGVSLLEEIPPIADRADYQELRDTVASLRLDNVLASGMGTSRGKTLEWISQGRVMVNHEPEQHADRRMQEGDLISIRGFGRIKIVEVGQPTRKGRLPVTLRRFAGKN